MAKKRYELMTIAYHEQEIRDFLALANQCPPRSPEYSLFLALAAQARSDYLRAAGKNPITGNNSIFGSIGASRKTAQS